MKAFNSLWWTQHEPSEKESGVRPNAPWVLAYGMRVLVLTGPPVKARTVMLWLFSSSFSSDDSGLDVVVPQWISCSCACVSRIKQSLCSHCQVISRNLPLPASCPTALCLVSEDCSQPSPPGIEAISAEPFNSLSHFVLFSKRTSLQTHAGLCNEALMFNRNGNS